MDEEEEGCDAEIGFQIYRDSGWPENENDSLQPKLYF
jgi:hypothetical protein